MHRICSLTFSLLFILSYVSSFSHAHEHEQGSSQHTSCHICPLFKVYKAFQADETQQNFLKKVIVSVSNDYFIEEVATYLSKNLKHCSARGPPLIC